MEVTEEQVSSLMGSLTGIRLEAEKMGVGPRLNRFCHTACWVQWMSGRVFCEHDRQMCTTCGVTWLRFDEPVEHRELRANGKTCLDTITDDTKATLRCFK